MIPRIYETMEEAVADIPDGVTVMVGGFGPSGYPFNLMKALYDQGASKLTIVSNSGSTFGKRGPVDLGHFLTQGRIAKVIGVGISLSGHPSRMSLVERFYRDGTIEVESLPQGTMAERIRAGGAGIGAFFTPVGVGTEIAEGKEYREINGRGHILEYALTADYALIHAWKADTAGNLIYRRSSRNFNPIMAMAADCTIVEVEEPILPAGQLDPDQIHSPGISIHRIVHIPPTGTRKINIREMREQFLSESQKQMLQGTRENR